MDTAKLTQMSRQAVTDAQNIARRLNHNEVDTWHLLSALLTQENGLVSGIVDKLGLTAAALALAVDRELERLPKVTGSVDTSKIYVTQALNDVLTRTEEEAKSLKDDFVPVEHLLLGLLDVAKPARGLIAGEVEEGSTVDFVVKDDGLTRAQSAKPVKK